MYVAIMRRLLELFVIIFETLLCFHELRGTENSHVMCFFFRLPQHYERLVVVELAKKKKILATCFRNLRATWLPMVKIKSDKVEK